MKKTRILALVLALVMALGLMLSGCGSEGTTTTNPPAADGDNSGTRPALPAAP